VAAATGGPAVSAPDDQAFLDWLQGDQCDDAAETAAAAARMYAADLGQLRAALAAMAEQTEEAAELIRTTGARPQQTAAQVAAIHDRHAQRLRRLLDSGDSSCVAISEEIE
jgi:hypothetical protein